ncbi:MAG: response regulator [Anaerolineae bacterium]|nr:response regulator [Anaerolineae bacterium]
MDKLQKILIVDDDENLRKTLADILQFKGYTPIAIGTGAKALEIIEDAKPVVALLDLRLEDMSGLDVVREIKNRQPDTECIVLTGYASQSSAIEAINLGAYSYVQKPYDLDQLLLTIRRAIEKRAAEAALREERANLARRVAERTAELSAANAELARSARLKDEFLASMSHELRTPLNAILGMAETIDVGVYGELTPKQHQALHTITQSGQHLLSLINDVLDIAKIGAGKLTLKLRPVSVEEICRCGLQIIQQMAQKKKQTVSFTFDSRITTIQADERRLTQIIVNLLSNAVKFTPEGKRIGLIVEGDREREVVNFTIWDTGIGISAEEMDRLFKPFVQLDSSLSRRYEGTGLGLVLASRLAEMHSGGITVESEVGEGSRFIVSLPWIEPDEETMVEVNVTKPSDKEFILAASAANLKGNSGPLVLLAEDNEYSIQTVADYLLTQGYRVLIARNGVEAIKYARSELPDIILMDIQMPEMNGLDATQRLRADPSTAVAAIPIIALTALTMPGDEEKCMEAGADVYLSKPVSLKRITQIIESYLPRVE